MRTPVSTFTLFTILFCIQGVYPELIPRKRNIFPLLASPNQLLINPVSSTTHIQHFGHGAVGPVLVLRFSRNKGYVAHVKDGYGIHPDLDLERSFENFECCSSGGFPGWYCVTLTLTLARSVDHDSRHGKVDILRLGRRAQRLHDLVFPMLAVEVFGAVIVGDKVWLSGCTQRVGGFVPLADGGGTVDKVPTGVEVQLRVYVESLQAGDGAGVRAAGGGTVTRRGGVGRVGSGGVVLTKGIKEFP